MKSMIKKLPGHILFPSNRGERIYQLPFFKNEKLPKEYQRWQTTVDRLLHGVDCDGEMYLMVDQGKIRKGDCQRRPGVHVDGHWDKTLSMHHPGHRLTARGWDTGGGSGWNNFDDTRGGIILASDVLGSKAYLGEFEGKIKDGGDCSEISTEGLSQLLLQPYVGYLGNVTLLHESIPVDRDCKRTLVRITLPEDFEFPVEQRRAA